MKNALKHFVILLVAAIATFELVNLAFWLMCQSDSYLFYLGLIIVSTLMFIGGYTIGLYAHKTYVSLKNKSDKKDESSN
jgi:ABC-type uncharacterized transport system permease subunit